MRSLKVLNINNNRFVELPAAATRLPLGRLYCNHNYIAAFPPTLLAMKTLKVAAVTSNPLIQGGLSDKPRDLDGLAPLSLKELCCRAIFGRFRMDEAALAGVLPAEVQSYYCAERGLCDVCHGAYFEAHCLPYLTWTVLPAGPLVPLLYRCCTKRCYRRCEAKWEGLPQNVRLV